MSAGEVNERGDIEAEATIVEVVEDQWADHPPGDTLPYDVYKDREKPTRLRAHRIREEDIHRASDTPEAPKTPPKKHRVGKAALLIAGVTLAVGVGATIGEEYVAGDFAPHHIAVGIVECSGGLTVKSVVIVTGTGNTTTNAAITSWEGTKAIVNYNADIGDADHYTTLAGCGPYSGNVSATLPYAKSIPKAEANIPQTSYCEPPADGNKNGAVCGPTDIALVPKPTPTTIPAAS